MAVPNASRLPAISSISGRYFDWMAKVDTYCKFVRTRVWMCRYDHFAVLCELLPVATPSLAINLLTLQNGVYNESVESLYLRMSLMFQNRPPNRR